MTRKDARGCVVVLYRATVIGAECSCGEERDSKRRHSSRGQSSRSRQVAGGRPLCGKERARPQLDVQWGTRVRLRFAASTRGAERPSQSVNILLRRAGGESPRRNSDTNACRRFTYWTEDISPHGLQRRNKSHVSHRDPLSA